MLIHSGDISITNQADGDIGISVSYDGILQTDEHIHSGESLLLIQVDGDADILSQYDGELVNFLPVITDGEIYTGDYEVISFVADPLLITSLTLPCRDKLMTDNVTVYSVPTDEQPNDAGGVTFTIGGAT